MTRLGAFSACVRLGFRQAIREWLFASIGIFAAITAVLAILGNELSVRQEEKVLKDVGLAVMELSAVFLALGAGVSVVFRETERRSFFFVLSRPISRSTFIVGKFLGVTAAQMVNLLGLTAVLCAGIVYLRASIDAGLAVAVLGIALQVLLVTAISLAFSTWTTPGIATVGALSAYLAGRWSDIIRNAREIAPDTPQWLWESLYLVLPNYRYMDLKSYAIYSEPPGPHALLLIAGYAISYATVAVAIGATGFSKRDLR